MSWLVSSCDQSIWNFSFSMSPCDEYSGLISSRIDWFDSLLPKRLSRVFSNTTVQKHQFFSAWPSLWSNSHILEKNIALNRRTFVSKVMSLLFNMLSSFVIAFLPRRKCLSISWLHDVEVYPSHNEEEQTCSFAKSETSWKQLCLCCGHEEGGDRAMGCMSPARSFP